MRKKKAKTIFEVLSLVLLIFIVVSAVSNLNENVMAGQGEMPVLKEPKVLQEEVLVCPKEGMGRPVPFVVDWDNDGKKDLLLGEIQSAGIRLFKNKGTDAKPYFPDSEYLQAEGTMLMVGFSCAHSVCPYVADWNNDGKKDLIVGTTPGYVGVYLNVGTNDSPMFGSSTEDPPAMFALSAEGKDIDVGEQAAPCVTDWNNDGKKDLLVGCEGGTISLFLNIGTDAENL